MPEMQEYYVNGYQMTQQYGGPEEGGWWYSEYTHIDTALVTPNEAAAISWMQHLRDLMARFKGHRWNVPMVRDDDDGDYDHMVSVSHFPLVYFVEDSPGEDYDTHPGAWY